MTTAFSETNSDTILMDSFIFDPKTKTVGNIQSKRDCFPEVFMNEIAGKDLEIRRDENGQHIIVTDARGQKKEIATVKNWHIISLNLPTTEIIGDNFLHSVEKLEKITMPKVKKTGHKFLYEAEALKEIHAEAWEETGEDCLTWNQNLQVLDLPRFQKAGLGFLEYNHKLFVLHAPLFTQWPTWGQRSTHEGKHIYISMHGLFGAPDMMINAPCLLTKAEFLAAGRAMNTQGIPLDSDGNPAPLEPFLKRLPWDDTLNQYKDILLRQLKYDSASNVTKPVVFPPEEQVSLYKTLLTLDALSALVQNLPEQQSSREASHKRPLYQPDKSATI